MQPHDNPGLYDIPVDGDNFCTDDTHFRAQCMIEQVVQPFFLDDQGIAVQHYQVLALRVTGCGIEQC